MPRWSRLDGAVRHLNSGGNEHDHEGQDKTAESLAAGSCKRTFKCQPELLGIGLFGPMFPGVPALFQTCEAGTPARPEAVTSAATRLATSRLQAKAVPSIGISGGMVLPGASGKSTFVVRLVMLHPAEGMKTPANTERSTARTPFHMQGNRMPSRPSLQQRQAQKAVRQRAYRQRQKDARCPSRDDIATTTFLYLVQETARVGSWDTFNEIMNRVTDRLVERGFDRQASTQAIDGLIDRYEDGWEFQRRRAEDSDDE